MTWILENCCSFFFWQCVWYCRQSEKLKILVIFESLLAFIPRSVTHYRVITKCPSSVSLNFLNFLPSFKSLSFCALLKNQYTLPWSPNILFNHCKYASCDMIHRLSSSPPRPPLFLAIPLCPSSSTKAKLQPCLYVLPMCSPLLNFTAPRYPDSAKLVLPPPEPSLINQLCYIHRWAPYSLKR